MEQSKKFQHISNQNPKKKKKKKNPKKREKNKAKTIFEKIMAENYEN